MAAKLAAETSGTVVVKPPTKRKKKSSDIGKENATPTEEKEIDKDYRPGGDVVEATHQVPKLRQRISRLAKTGILSQVNKW